MSALRPMKTAARPTRLWKPATSSGICVICTRAATTGADRAADDHHRRQQPVVAGAAEDRGDDGERHADDAVPDGALGLLLVGEAAEGEDEEDRRPRGRRRVTRPRLMAALPQLFWNMASIRRVTRKPPKMFTEAISVASAASSDHEEAPRADLQQRAEDDDRRDAVGDRHQRRVQRVR